MAISERDLKVLWGRAAGRCSICKIQVIADKQTVSETYPIGEGAHIIAEKIGGPRGDAELPESLRNSYLNLILLCPNCHTKIDKAPEDFPAERLYQFKNNHESEMALLHPSDKDNYDEFLQFSLVTEQNWLSPDRKNYIPFGVTKEQWIAPFLEPHLETFVPRNVIRAFEVARACMIYSWFFYPLATLGLEQLFRVGQFAVRERCRVLHPNIDNFEEELKMLVANKIILPTDEPRWRAVGHLTEDRAFLAGATLCDPGQAISTLRSTADLINALFSESNNRKP
jgi:HNH endonuclease